jgi:hypothetical protein
VTLKFTQSRDGRPRATLTIKTRVGLDDIVSAICYELARTECIEDVSEVPRITKAYVERTVKEVLHRVGHESYGYWQDGVDRDFAEELEDTVQKAVLKLYPEL